MSVVLVVAFSITCQHLSPFLSYSIFTVGNVELTEVEVVVLSIADDQETDNGVNNGCFHLSASFLLSFSRPS